MLNIATALLAAAAAAVPAMAAPAAQGLCGQFQNYQGSYEVSNNLWGEGSLQGTQCAYVNTDTAQGVSWYSQMNWPQGAPGGDPISFTYSGLPISQPKTVGSIKSMKTHAQWSYSPLPKGNVAYDIFTAKDPKHPIYPTGDWEIMVWLKRNGGIQPKGKVIAPGIKVGAYTFDLWYGKDQNSGTYSFMATNEIDCFDDDLQAYFQYLITEQGFDAQQQVTQFQFGSEVWQTSGDTRFTIEGFNASVQ